MGFGIPGAALAVTVVFVLLLGSVQACILINEFEPNPEGADRGNEWIELHNNCSESVDMTGMVLVNGDGDEYVIDDISLEAGGYWLHTFNTYWLDNKDENVTLKDGDDIIHATPTKNDGSNDGRTWSLCPSGWELLSGTPGQDNACTGEEPEKSGEGEPAAEQESYIEIKSISFGKDKKAKFGQSIDVEVEIYRGDTDKYAVYLWVENTDGRLVSEVSTIHAKNLDTTYNLMVPLVLKPNCNIGYPNGTHVLFAEGLGSSHSWYFLVEGNSPDSCGTVYVDAKTNQTLPFDGGCDGDGIEDAYNLSDPENLPPNMAIGEVRANVTEPEPSLESEDPTTGMVTGPGTGGQPFFGELFSGIFSWLGTIFKF